MRRSLPWHCFLESTAYHVIAMTLLIGFTHLFALRARIETKPAFDHSQVVYYRPSESLPPLDTLRPSDDHPRKADPEFSRQPIISVPREAANRSQTIVTPPPVKLKADVALPNIVAWSDTVQKPRLAIPPAPLSPAAELTRLPPTLQNPVVAPPDASHLAQRRNSPTLQDPVAAPPSGPLNCSEPLLKNFNPRSSPPRRTSQVPLRENSGPERRTERSDRSRASTSSRGPADDGGGRRITDARRAASRSSTAFHGDLRRVRITRTRDRPQCASRSDAPPDPPAGNRRGIFAATPEGHAGALGTPGSPVRKHCIRLSVERWSQ